MTPLKLLPAVLLTLALGASSLAYAQDATDAPPSTPPVHDGKGPDAKGWHHQNPLLELLPDDKRKLLHDTMQKAREDNKPLWEQAKKLHEERDALLKAPKFDQDAFLKKSAELDALHDKLKQNREKTFATVAAQFSPEERRVLLVMEHMHHHMHGHGEWGHHGDHGPSPDQGEHQPS